MSTRAGLKKKNGPGPVRVEIQPGLTFLPYTILLIMISVYLFHYIHYLRLNILTKLITKPTLIPIIRALFYIIF